MGRSYTKDVVALSEHVDEFINYDELEKQDLSVAATVLRTYKADGIVHVFPQKRIARLAKKAGIRLRVGTTNRWYHWLNCNRLIRLSRKRSDLHEAQLNLKLLNFTGLTRTPALSEIPEFYGCSKVPVLKEDYKGWIDPGKFNLILHPRSKGSAREWGLDNFARLIDALPDSYKIFVSGTREDGAGMKDLLQHARVMDITGRLSLEQFTAFIGSCDGLVAASTGPLHIAAALGKRSVGLFSPRRPIHPGRWGPLGKHAGWLVADAACEKCAAGKDCDCIRNISPQQVIQQLEKR